MKVLLVVCFVGITLLSQGWGEKHYLVKTKDGEGGKYDAEAGDDYAEDEDINDHHNELYSYDQGDEEDNYDQDNDDDTYDEHVDEDDVESLMRKEMKENELQVFEGMKNETKGEVLEIMKEAINTIKEGNAGEDYSARIMQNLKLVLHGVQDFMEVISRLLNKISAKPKSKYNCKRCRRMCRKRSKKRKRSRRRFGRG